VDASASGARDRQRASPAVGNRLDAAFERLIGPDVHPTQQPAQPGVLRRFGFDPPDHGSAVRIEQRQHELVVKLHRRRLVGLRAQHFQREIERAVRPPVRQMIETKECRPGGARPVAPAQALHRTPHRAEF
jgi:hypothetical protein